MKYLLAAIAEQSVNGPASHAVFVPANRLVPAVRIERTTFRLQGGCSTN
jgi:hypothetical protein